MAMGVLGNVSPETPQDNVLLAAKMEMPYRWMNQPAAVGA